MRIIFRFFMILVISVLTVSCKPNLQEESDIANAGVGSKVTKAVWVAVALSSSTNSWLVEKASFFGLNTIVVHAGRADASAINAFSGFAKNYGIEVQAWVEDGIKSSVPPPANERHLYLPCNDQGLDKGFEKWYLDVRKTEARRYFISKAIDLINQLNVSAVQWDDHVGYPVKNLTCVSKSMHSELTTGLTALMQELKAAVSSTKPGMKLVLSHHNINWSLSRFLSNWKAWPYDQMFTQAYVSKNVPSEITKAKQGKVTGIGLYYQDPNIVANTRKVLQAGLSVIFFNLPEGNGAVATELAKVLKAYGNNPSNPGGSSNGSSAASVAEAGGNATVSEGAQVENGPRYDTQPLEPFAGGADSNTWESATGPAKNDGSLQSCASISEQQIVSWRSSCKSFSNLGITNMGTPCELKACQLAGGGQACGYVKAFVHQNFCKEMLPLIEKAR